MKSLEEKLEKINDKIANSKSIIGRRENEIMKSKILKQLISMYNYKGMYLRNFQKEKQMKNINQIIKQKALSSLINLPQIYNLHNSRNNNQYSIKRKLEKANEYNMKSKLINYNSKILKNKLLKENIIKIKVQNLQNEIGKINAQNFYKLKKEYINNLNEKDIKKLEKENLKMLNEINYIKKLNNNISENTFPIARNNSQIIKSYNSLYKKFL